MFSVICRHFIFLLIKDLILFIFIEMCENRMHQSGQYTRPALSHSGDEPCDFCEAIVQHWREILTANTTEEEFKEVCFIFIKKWFWAERKGNSLKCFRYFGRIDYKLPSTTCFSHGNSCDVVLWYWRISLPPDDGFTYAWLGHGLGWWVIYIMTDLAVCNKPFIMLLWFMCYILYSSL